MIDEARILMAEAVMVLSPDMARQQIIERTDRPPPLDRPRHLQPFGMLVEHRIDDVNECLIAVEQTVSAGQQIALEPALAEMFGQHLHDASAAGEMLVIGFDRSGPRAVGHLEHRIEPIGCRFIGTHDAEVPRLGV